MLSVVENLKKIIIIIIQITKKKSLTLTVSGGNGCSTAVLALGP